MYRCGPCHIYLYYPASNYPERIELCAQLIKGLYIFTTDLFFFGGTGLFTLNMPYNKERENIINIM